jgi:hypothetical protein
LNTEKVAEEAVATLGAAIHTVSLTEPRRNRLFITTDSGSGGGAWKSMSADTTLIEEGLRSEVLLS